MYQILTVPKCRILIEGNFCRRGLRVSQPFSYRTSQTNITLSKRRGSGSLKLMPHLLPAISNSSSSGSGVMMSEDPDEDLSPTQPSLLGSLLSALRSANAYLPQVVAASTALALIHPPSFTWFSTKYYAPALGFLMFAVGLNLGMDDFKRAFKQPGAIVLGYVAQFGLKPLLGVLIASTLVPLVGLPEAIGSGLILTSCVSGAQLSNYATFLVDPLMAPLSIVLTALSTATAVVVTPALTLLLLGKRLPVDPGGMMTSITQIVAAPIAVGLLLNKYAAPFASALRPCLPLLSVLTTALCVGSPLATNIGAVRSQFGFALLLPVCALHVAGFVGGYGMSAAAFKGQPALARTISFETGMQSSLLGLALANKFFSDPLVGLPSALSVIVMSLMGFCLVTYWNEQKLPGPTQL